MTSPSGKRIAKVDAWLDSHAPNHGAPFLTIAGVVLFIGIPLVGCDDPAVPKAPKTRQECLLCAIDKPDPLGAAKVCRVMFPEPETPEVAAPVVTKPSAPAQEAIVEDHIKPEESFVWYTTSVAGECASFSLDYRSTFDHGWCSRNALSLVDHKWYLVCEAMGHYKHTTTWRMDPNPNGYTAVLVAGKDDDGSIVAILYKEQAACQIAAQPVKVDLSQAASYTSPELIKAEKKADQKWKQHHKIHIGVDDSGDQGWSASGAEPTMSKLEGQSCTNDGECSNDLVCLRGKCRYIKE